MATTLERNKNRSRPRKSPGARARRQRQQRARLVALGMPEAEVAALNSRELLDHIGRPKKVAEKYAK